MSNHLIIIIKSCQQHRFICRSLTICPYRTLLLASPLDYIQCLHRADERLVFPCVEVPQENPVYEFAFTSPAVPIMSFSFYVDSFCCCFVRCYFQDLFKTARSILVQFLSGLFSWDLVKIQVVQPYDSTNTTTESPLIISERMDFQMIDNLLGVRQGKF